MTITIITLLLFSQLLATACRNKDDNTYMIKSHENLEDKVKRLKQKYDLTDFSFDAECIYEKGDLSHLLENALAKLLPSDTFTITETISTDETQYMATISYRGQKLVDVFADTYADFLPDDFTMIFDSIPDKMNSGKKFYAINPRLLGQDMWYFCGSDNNLQKAKAEGLPILLPNEDMRKQDLSPYEE